MDGILVVDKPTGMTSHDVVDFMRKRFRAKKVGHCGTLDPMATGVLVILIGKATKLSNIFINDDKEYEAILTLGTVTDTGDSEGKVLSREEVKNLDRLQVGKVFREFVGEIDQIPPMVSAVRYRGERLYKLARKGLEVPRQSRKVHIKKIKITDFNPPNISFRVICSKGTYIRKLCEDIGERLGCGGHQSWLRRVRSGPFSIKDAVTLERLKEISDSELEGLLHSMAPYVASTSYLYLGIAEKSSNMSNL